MPSEPTPSLLGTVSAIVPTLNEERRLGPCLAGLTGSSYEVQEIIVIDSLSQDGTQEVVKAAMPQDPRLRLLLYDPQPQNWVGPTGALHEAFLQSSPLSEWILRLDADTYPHPGLAASLVETAIAEKYDVLSLAPQFILKYPGESWLHPAMLISFAYRSFPVGTQVTKPQRVMANGQCFLIRRSVLDELGGYAIARRAFCDDVKLARYAAQKGFKVGFLDGTKILKVRMYEGAIEIWQELKRTISLKDASTPVQMWIDVLFLLLVQGLPLILSLLLLNWVRLGLASTPVIATLSLNLLLMAVRVGMLWAMLPSFDRTSAKAPWLFWLSPLADPLAWWRVFLSAIAKPTQWRGRKYN
ncbi:MAG: glycosyltransferase [Oscillatoria sp. SIO1A7]|nr:glycosyltransferase [Oscillatoria sp. SIO1A7]